jgi:hypothetical protein
LGTLLLAKDAKRYAKFEIVIDTQVTDVNVLDFVLIVEIAISEPITPVLSRSAKNILRKFPSWMEMYTDSEDQVNQDNYVPKSVGGKFINAVVSENLDYFDTQVDIHNINRFIGSADLNQVSWMWSSVNVPNTYNKIIGDNIELTRLDSMTDLYEARSTDYVYFHNPVNREIITIRNFESLIAYNNNTSPVELPQIPVQRFNWFDEFGARVGLNRLYLEENESFKFRILDVFINPISTDINGFKRTLRRELNLWDAFGATPDHTTDYATPLIMEMSDIESSLEYFNADGSPKEKFTNLVIKLNEKYPTNWGYFSFNNAIWDTAGLSQEGVNRLSANYSDEINDFAYYQPGVGDLSDSEIIIYDNSATPQWFTTNLVATGKKKIGTHLENSPIEINYEYYSDYKRYIYDNQSATINLTVEATLLPYGTSATPRFIYSPITRLVKNQHAPTSSASPEFNTIQIFDTDGYLSSDLNFRYKDTRQPATISFNNLYSTTRIPYNKVSDMKLKNGLWNGTQYSTPNSNTFAAFFSHKSDKLISTSSEINASTPSFTPNTVIKLVSNVYNLKQVTEETVPVKDKITLNDTVDASKKNVNLPLDLIKSNIIYPVGATPQFTYVNVIPPTNTFNSPDQGVSDNISVYGGAANYTELDRDLFVPSSPNIIASIYGTSLPSNPFGFINSENAASTVNYHFGKLKYNATATPRSITIKSNEGNVYPFEIIDWEPFEIHSTPKISAIVDENGIVKYLFENGEYIPGLNSNIIDLPEITRETFGISGSSKFDYFFENIKVLDPESVNVSIWSDQSVVKPFLNRTFILESSIANAISNAEAHIQIIDYPLDSVVESFDSTRNTTVFNNIRVRGKLYDNKIDSKLRTGWLSIGKEENYIYADPITENFIGNLFSIQLTHKPHQGAPIIVDILDQNSTPITSYQEIAFSDEATPGKISFYNKEVLKPKPDNSFYLGYKNVYDLSIKDLNTGETIQSNYATPGYRALASDVDRPLTMNREYEIIYRVKDSYYIDTVNIADEYKAQIHFDSTPGSSYKYQITYENSVSGNSTPLVINMDPLTSWIGEGYLAISNEEYNFDRVQCYVSPPYVVNDGNDYCDISIISLDINGNPKPHQSFNIVTNKLTSSVNRVTTDLEGYAHFTVISNYSTTAKQNGTITISGINYQSDPTAHKNSQSASSVTNLIIEVIPQDTYVSNKIKADVVSKKIQADSVSSNYINGIVTQNGIPTANTVVYWRKARYNHTIFNSINYSTSSAAPGSSNTSGLVRTDSEGKFSIGPFTANGNTDPGYWFVAVETDFSSISSANPTTTDGDIVYWLEEYDSINYNYINSINIVDVVNYDSEKSLDLYATPNFLLNYYSIDKVDVLHSTPRWSPPKWFATSRYDQYQSGRLGDVPYSINDYNNLIKDYEEE